MPDDTARQPRDDAASAPMVRATDLYQLAECAHKVALSRALPREELAERDEASALLIEAGLALEERVAERLDYPRPEHGRENLEAAARETEALMRAGVPGLYQGVLLVGRYVAMPDLLERAPGASALGDFHYLPGDVKAGLEPRADQVLQVAFSGFLLEELWGRAPAEGFLVMGDERTERFSLGEIELVARAALARVEAILDGREQTEAFLSETCPRCEFRGRCLPPLVAAEDLSLVEGMTPARRALLRERGVSSVSALGRLKPKAWREAGGPRIDIESLTRQARALAGGGLPARRGYKLEPAPAGELLVHAEADPLDGGRPGLLAWALRPAGSRTIEEAAVHALVDDAGRAAAIRALLEASDRAPTARPLALFGGATLRVLDLLGELAGLPGKTLARLERRALDLRAALRRANSYLPVRRYTLDEIDALLEGRETPAIPEPEEAAFVALARLRALRALGVEGPGPGGQTREERALLEELDALGRARLERLARLAAWMRQEEGA